MRGLREPPAVLAAGAAAPDAKLGHLDPRSALAYCDRRFVRGAGAGAAAAAPALPPTDALKEWRYAVRDFNDADEGANGDAARHGAFKKKRERRLRDRCQRIDHCGAIVCPACRARPSHACADR